VGDLGQTSSDRRHAARALGHIGDPQAIEALERVLQTPDETLPSVSAEAAYALGRIGNERSIEPLVKALGTGNRETTLAASHALVWFGPRAAMPIASAAKILPSGPGLQDAMRALAELGTGISMDQLLALLRKHSKDSDTTAAIHTTLDAVMDAAARSVGKPGAHRGK
jgi:HEAT repeat protein